MDSPCYFLVDVQILGNTEQIAHKNFVQNLNCRTSSRYTPPVDPSSNPPKQVLRAAAIKSASLQAEHAPGDTRSSVGLHFIHPSFDSIALWERCLQNREALLRARAGPRETRGCATARPRTKTGWRETTQTRVAAAPGAGGCGGLGCPVGVCLPPVRARLYLNEGPASEPDDLPSTLHHRRT